MARNPLQVGPNSSKLFGEFRATHRRLSRALSAADDTHKIVNSLQMEDFEKSDEDLVEMVVDRHERLTAPPTWTEPKQMSPKSSSHYHRFGLTVELDGTLSLVDWWPDEVADVQALAADPVEQDNGWNPPSPRWIRKGNVLNFVAHVDMVDDTASDAVKPLLVSEAERVIAILTAISDQTQAHHRAVRDRALEAVRDRRAHMDAARSVAADIPIPQREQQNEPEIEEENTTETPTPVELATTEFKDEKENNDGLSEEVDNGTTRATKKWIGFAIGPAAGLGLGYRAGLIGSQLSWVAAVVITVFGVLATFRAKHPDETWRTLVGQMLLPALLSGAVTFGFLWFIFFQGSTPSDADEEVIEDTSTSTTVSEGTASTTSETDELVETPSDVLSGPVVQRLSVDVIDVAGVPISSELADSGLLAVVSRDAGVLSLIDLASRRVVFESDPFGGVSRGPALIEEQEMVFASRGAPGAVFGMSFDGARQVEFPNGTNGQQIVGTAFTVAAYEGSLFVPVAVPGGGGAVYMLDGATGEIDCVYEADVGPREPVFSDGLMFTPNHGSDTMSVHDLAVTEGCLSGPVPPIHDLEVGARPQKPVVDVDGRVWVGTTAANRISVFDPDEVRTSSAPAAAMNVGRYGRNVVSGSAGESAVWFAAETHAGSVCNETDPEFMGLSAVNSGTLVGLELIDESTIRVKAICAGGPFTRNPVETAGVVAVANFKAPNGGQVSVTGFDAESGDYRFTIVGFESPRDLRAVGTSLVVIDEAGSVVVVDEVDTLEGNYSIISNE